MRRSRKGQAQLRNADSGIEGYAAYPLGACLSAAALLAPVSMSYQCAR